MRARAVRRIRPFGGGAQHLSQILIEDPASQVRLAAATRLGRAEPAVALPLLVPGLSDPAPAVVVGVLDALSLVGDSSLVPQIQPLLEHADPTVRRRAAAVMRVLELPGS